MTDIREEIKASTLSLLLNAPFFGFIVSKMKFIEEKSSHLGGIPTAATDGKNIYYNTEFFENLDPKERTFVIGHEILHCVLDTFGRKGDRDHQYWNMATDYVINDVLKNENLGTMPKVALWDAKYKGWIAEQVYEDLKKNNAGKKETLDVHIEEGNPNNDDGESSGKEGKENKDGGKKTIKVSKKELEENMKEMKKMIIEAHQRCKMAGHNMGGIEFLIDDLINPKINWKQLLNVSIQSVFKDDITWNRPNRRNPVRGMILPTLGYQDTVDICVSIDTSGSISDEQRKIFLSEIAGILNYYKNFKLKLWCFDTQVCAFKEYDTHNINDLVNYQPGGGGGTDIACNFKFLEENGIVPKQFVILTDAYNGESTWGYHDYCPCVAIIHSNPRPDVPDGIRWALFEDLVGE